MKLVSTKMSLGYTGDGLLVPIFAEKNKKEENGDISYYWRIEFNVYDVVTGEYLAPFSKILSLKKEEYAVWGFNEICNFANQIGREYECLEDWLEEITEPSQRLKWAFFAKIEENNGFKKLRRLAEDVDLAYAETRRKFGVNLTDVVKEDLKKYTETIKNELTEDNMPFKR